MSLPQSYNLFRTPVKSLLITILALTATAIQSLAQTDTPKRDFPRFTFGLEADFAMTFANAYHYNFIAEEGDRIDIRNTDIGFFPNGHILVNAGVNVSGKFNISLEYGLCGVYRNEHILPLYLKGTWFSGCNPLENRWLIYGAIGGAVKDAPIAEQRLLGAGKVGGGWRVSLNRYVKLDFLAGIHGAFIHPQVFQSGNSSVVQPNMLRRNDAYIVAMTLGVGLTF